MLDLDEIALVVHDLANVLIGVGVLVEQALRIAVPRDAVHRVDQGILGQLLAGCSARQPATRAVRRRAIGRWIAETRHDERTGGHRPWDDPHAALRRVDRSLSRHPHFDAMMRFARGVVVVTLDRLAVDNGTVAFDRVRHRLGQNLHDSPHHFGSVLERVVLGPQHAVDVRGKVVGALDKVGEIRVVEGLVERLLQLVLRPPNMFLSEQVARTTRARMQNDPDPIVLVNGELDEVVAAAQRSELGRDLLRVELVALHLGRGTHDAIEHLRPNLATTARFTMGTRSPVTAARLARRHRLRNAAMQVRQLGIDLTSSEDGLLSDHAAADVDPDRGGDNRTLRGDNRTDRCAHAQVGIGHQREWLVDEVEARCSVGLVHGLVVEVGGPRQHVADPGWCGHVVSYTELERNNKASFGDPPLG